MVRGGVSEGDSERRSAEHGSSGTGASCHCGGSLTGRRRTTTTTTHSIVTKVVGRDPRRQKRQYGDMAKGHQMVSCNVDTTPAFRCASYTSRTGFYLKVNTIMIFIQVLLFCLTGCFLVSSSGIRTMNVHFFSERLYRLGACCVYCRSVVP